MKVNYEITEGVAFKNNKADISGIVADKNTKIKDIQNKPDKVIAVYYAIQQVMEVDENLSDDEIEALVKKQAGDREFTWSKEDNLFNYE